MREARIILPLASNSGASLASVHKALADKLTQAFGGYTAFNSWGPNSWGPWKGITEPGITYDIACEDSFAATRNLLAIARWARAVASQDTVYIRLPVGVVQFVTD